MLLIMDEGEILREYRGAKKKTEQVRILAELNCVSNREMATWLADHGQNVDKRFFAQGRQKNTPLKKGLKRAEKEREMETKPKAEVTEPVKEPEAPRRVEPEVGSLTAPREVLEIKPSQTAKADAGKPRLTLVPMQIIWDIAAVREWAVTHKYPEKDNWKTVEPERIREALLRHVLRYEDDLDGVDDETGLPHLYHVATNCAFLCAMEARHNA